MLICKGNERAWCLSVELLWRPEVERLWVRIHGTD